MPHYVYKYVYNDEIIYIGKTDSDLKQRLSQHGKTGDNIDREAWNEINSSEIYYITLANSIMCDVVESELIRRYKPKYNKAKMSDWSGLPFDEPEWEKYIETPQQPAPKKKSKRITEKTIKSKESVESKNIKAIEAFDDLISKIQNGTYYIKKWNVRHDKYTPLKELEWHIFISMSDDKLCKYSSIEYKTKSEGGIYSLTSTVMEDKEHGEYIYIYDMNRWLDMLNDSIYAINSLKKSHGEIYNTENVNLTVSKLEDLIDNHHRYFDINNPEIIMEPEPDYGLSIEIPRDKLGIRNEKYFWDWYVGCQAVWNNGSYILIYKNGKLSNPISWWDNMWRLDCENKQDDASYFMEKRTDYYFSYWRENLDNVPIMIEAEDDDCYITDLLLRKYNGNQEKVIEILENKKQYSEIDIYGKMNLGEKWYDYVATGEIVQDIKNMLQYFDDNNLTHGTGRNHKSNPYD